MIQLETYGGQKVGVFGLGISGEATVQALLAGGAEVYAWDDKQAGVEKLAKACPQAKTVPYDKWPWKHINTLVLSPGVPLTHPKPHLCVTAATMHGCKIVGDIELLREACPQARYIGITGTNGKSTTTALVGHIFREMKVKAQVGGNLGTPALALEPLKKDECYVLEMSSYQLDLLSETHFNIAVLLNIAPDHLDRHGGIEGYINAKRRIFDGQDVQDVAIICVDDEHGKAIYEEMKSGKHRFSWQGKGQRLIPVSVQRELKKGIYVKDGVIHDAENGGMVDIGAIPSLRGAHNWQNAAAAYAVAKCFNLTDNQIAEAMRSFEGLAHRMQQVQKIGEVLYVNDSKATNADAAQHSLKSFEDIYWILGGKAKEGGIESLTGFFPKIKKAYLIGEAAEDFAKLLAEHKVEHVIAGTLKNAFGQASDDALQAKKGVVLLAPACASFDQFDSFEQRGTIFSNLAKATKIKTHFGVKQLDATAAQG